MTPDEAAFDGLAGDLAGTDFDAVEREGVRAEWTDDGQTVTVTALEGQVTVTYHAEDLVRATSASELRAAREPDAP